MIYTVLGELLKLQLPSIDCSGVQNLTTSGMSASTKLDKWLNVHLHIACFRVWEVAPWLAMGIFASPHDTLALFAWHKSSGMVVKISHQMSNPF